MSDHVRREQYEMNPTDDSGYEAGGLDLFVHTVTRIEYYRSFEYSLKWGGSMYPRRSSRLSKGSTKSPRRSSSPNKVVIQRRLSGKKPKAGRRETKAVDNIIDADEGSARDIIDIINSTRDAKHVAEEDGGELLKVVDEGLDHSDEEDRYSVASSIASGPSLKWRSTPKKHKPLEGMCSACRKLYQKAKKMKAPLKNKLLDNNPKSLTCDQWVLLKKWTPRRLPNAKGKLWAHIQLLSERLMVKNAAKQTEQCAEPSACLRQHAFLQRNLRQNIKAPVKNQRKKNRRKRRRDDSQGPRVAKQQRLNSSNRRQHISMDCTNNDSLLPASVHSSSPGCEGRSEQEPDDSADTYLTVELIPSSVTLETTKLRGASPKQKTPKKTRGFRDLLAQLRGNSNMIVRETR